MPQADAEAIAAFVLHRIQVDWAGQTKHWNLGEMKKSLAEKVIRHNITARQLRIALEQFACSHYPPDIGALMATATKGPSIDESEARLSFRRAVTASSTRDFAGLDDDEWAAGVSIGWAEVRTLPGDGWQRWARALASARAGMLPNPPPRPMAAEALPAPPLSQEQKAKRGRRIEEMKKMCKGSTAPHILNISRG